MRILITGLPYFAKKLQIALSEFDKENHYFFYNTYYSRKDRLRFLFRLPFVHLVISLNGVSDKSGSMDWVLFFKKKLIFLWQGTDVLLASERFKAKSINRKYIDYAEHCTDAVWLKDELESIGISAKILHFKFINPSQKFDSFNEFSVYTYLPKGKENFYGWEMIKRAFNLLPDIKLFVYGSDGENFTCSKNIEFRGWIDSTKYQNEIAKHALYIRWTQHDGYALSVLDALGNGSEVIWNFPIEHALLIKENSYEVLVYLIHLVHEKLLNRNFQRNEEAIKWIKFNFYKENILRTFVDFILA